MSQFGYGRRTCQGQTVTEADHIAGIGAIAWLFNIEKLHQEPESRKIMLNEKASISEEELVTGLSEHASEDEEDNTPRTPIGAFPLPLIEEIREEAVRRIRRLRDQDEQKARDEDPTLIFSTLLIAKPLPFKFSLKPRDEKRVELVRRMFEEKQAQGEYVDSKEYCKYLSVGNQELPLTIYKGGKEHGKGQEFGWVKV
jgi:hypothetical protein